MRKVYLVAAFACAIAATYCVVRRDVEGARYETIMIVLFLIQAKLEEK